MTRPGDANQQDRLFDSFWQGGFECSTHTLRSGKRLDLVSSTFHDRFFERDYAALKQLGIRTVREGLRWHLIERERGQYDFSSAFPILEAAQRQGVQIIWDLFHFGWPGFLDIFHPDWIESFAGLASAFGRVLHAGMQGPAFVAPVNEISFLSWGGGDVAYINPFARGRGGELKTQLVRGAIRASQAIRSEIPDVRFVSPEPVIYIKGNPGDADDVAQAQRYTTSMFEAWDMLSGRVQPELGGNESYLDVIGINYYNNNQRWNHGPTIWRHQLDYRPFREILFEVYSRYQRPLFVSETGTEDSDRPDWLSYITQEVRAAMRLGVPLHGICLYPILNHPGWDDDRHCYNGLLDYPNADGEREIYEPLASELERHKDLEGKNNDPPRSLSRSSRLDLPVAPTMEFRVPASSALDEQIRPAPARFLRGGACF